MVMHQHGNTQLTIFTSASPDFAAMLKRLGQFRVGVWEAENKKPSQVQDGEGWLDPYDQIGRHFVLTRNERRRIPQLERLGFERITEPRSGKHFPQLKWVVM